MSLDLLQEFGNPSHNDFINPWASSSSHNITNSVSIEEDEFGDFAEPGVSNEPEKDAGQDKAYILASMTVAQHQDGLLVDTGTTRPSQSPSFQDLNAPLKLAIPQNQSSGNIVNNKPEESTPITAWPSYGCDRAKSFGKPLPLSPYREDEDDWGDFEEESHADAMKNEAIDRMRAVPNKEVKEDSSLDLTDSFEPTISPSAVWVAGPKALKVSTAKPAPSNIPPPSILLSIVVTIFEGLPDEIRDIVSSISDSLMNDAFPPSESLFENLLDKLAMTAASARILAGRKLRWKRDTHLAQRMSTGPANAGKAGGMKLTGVDRTESRREDQEAAEVVRLWKQQLGGLKNQIAKINAQQSEINLALPEYADNMPIRVAKLGEGGLGAPKCCFLCGLKRDERVARLDVNVEDSFGEWWVDHWGHVDCIRFWEEHKDSLKQR
ncbi:MAG: hypothetical protein Q9209_007301 [Squamulea sp. 1 TL-2023]